jgi:hypothetical protein
MMTHFVKSMIRNADRGKPVLLYRDEAVDL